MEVKDSENKEQQKPENCLRKRNRNRKRAWKFPLAGSAQPFLLNFHAIGHVRHAKGTSEASETLSEESLIVLLPEIADGLYGISAGDRLVVIFVFDRAGKFELRQHPRGDPSRARRGVFALRSPRRPNPIGVTSVEVLEIFDNVVRVRGLDAWQDSPILDLKPE